MRILITGNEGFVGNHIQKALERDNEIVGLEAKPTFREWYNEMYEIMDTPIDAVIHIGAISENQSERTDIYLWNSYATFLLAQRVRQRMNSLSSIPFIFFSSYLVESTMDDWETRSPYTWSKAQAETLVRECLPHATILRPGVMWGNEARKNPRYRSVPYRLAAHELEFLLRNWGRNYVHVDDVAEAVKGCLKYKHKGTYSMMGDHVWLNEDLAPFVEWKGYEWTDNPSDLNLSYVNSHVKTRVSPSVPGWEPQVVMKEALPALEKELNNVVRSCTTDKSKKKRG